MRALFPFEPTPEQVTAWTSVVQQGWMTYPQLVDHFASSDLSGIRRFLPVLNAIGKPLAADTVTSIAEAVRKQGTKEADIAADLVSTGGNYGATHTLTRWVRTLIRDLLGREGNHLEVAYFVRLIDEGQTTPADLARGLASNEEGRSHHIREQYRRLLGRDPSAAEVDALKLYSRREDVTIFLVAGDEYYRRNGGNMPAFIRAAHRDVAYFNPEAIPQSTIDTWAGRPRGELASALVSSEAVIEQFFKYLPDESLGVLRTGPLSPNAPGQPINPNPGFLGWMQSVVRGGGRLEDVIVTLVTHPTYFANASYWKGQYRSRGWRA